MPTRKPKPEPVSLYQPGSYFEPLPLDNVFETPQPLEVEIGPGNGSFLVNYAAQHPKKNFLGVERLLGRIRKLDRKIQRQGLTNVRILRVEAAYAIQYLIPPKSVSAFHIYFPDPWPKKKHWKNRLIAPALIPLLTQSLAPDGKIYLRTDNESYFEQMLETFSEATQFKAIDAPESLTKITTEFERLFTTQGIQTRRAQYQLTPES